MAVTQRPKSLQALPKTPCLKASTHEYLLAHFLPLSALKWVGF